MITNISDKLENLYLTNKNKNVKKNNVSKKQNTFNSIEASINFKNEFRIKPCSTYTATKCNDLSPVNNFPGDKASDKLKKKWKEMYDNLSHKEQILVSGRLLLEYKSHKEEYLKFYNDPNFSDRNAFKILDMAYDNVKSSLEAFGDSKSEEVRQNQMRLLEILSNFKNNFEEE